MSLAGTGAVLPCYSGVFQLYIFKVVRLNFGRDMGLPLSAAMIQWPEACCLACELRLGTSWATDISESFGVRDRPAEPDADVRPRAAPERPQCIAPPLFPGGSLGQGPRGHAHLSLAAQCTCCQQTPCPQVRKTGCASWLVHKRNWGKGGFGMRGRPQMCQMCLLVMKLCAFLNMQNTKRKTQFFVRCVWCVRMPAYASARACA